MKYLVTLILVFCSTHLLFSQSESSLIYKNSKEPIEKRIDDLISRMTLAEKIAQLNQSVVGKNDNANNSGNGEIKVKPEIGSLIYTANDPKFRNEIQRNAMEKSRLSIPIIFGFDVIHGYKTIFPIPLAQSCSWNPELVKQSCSIAAKESRSSGVDWTFSPMIDVARDGRWGRIAEGYGEDPYTNAVFAVSAVKGYQGDNLSSNNSVAACLKHYVGYGASEGGRDYVYTEISRQTLWDTYLPSFEAGVKAGAATVMSAFNDISGVPASANHYTLTEILKDRWKHDGFVVSDWNSVTQLISQGVAGTKKEAAYKAFSAGVEMDMADRCYQNYLPELLNEGKITIDMIDNAVKRVLRVKFRLGLFEHPYVSEVLDDKRLLLPNYLTVANKIAEESIVLLKNNNNTLPLSPHAKIAIIGPMAKDKSNLLGSWFAHGEATNVSSIYDGLVSEFKNDQLLYAEGCDFVGEDISGFPDALSVSKQADIIVLCLGEKKDWSGENASRSSLALPQIQEQLLLELKKLGKPIILLLANGRPLELNRIEPVCDAIVELWQPGIAGGKPVAGVLSGRVNPSGKLAVTFPYASGQIPIYYNMRKSGRPKQGNYRGIPATPLYEFSYGLSFTTFQYGELKTPTLKLKRTDKLVVEIPVTNIGKRDGLETVHWFISAQSCSISRPIKELKYFDKQMIKVGETVIFRFNIDPERDFSFVDGNGHKFLEPGLYSVMVKDKIITIELMD